MTTNFEFDEIPVIDIGLEVRPGDENAPNERLCSRSELSAEVGRVCHEVGFFVVTGHGIPSDVIENVFAAAGDFFALPLEAKQSIDKRKSPHFRGWEPIGAEKTNNRPDIREQVDLWSEHLARPADVTPDYLRLLGPNQWPSEALAPHFRTSVETWLEAVQPLASEVLALLAAHLELPETHFEQTFGVERMSLTKLIRYPRTPAGACGVNAHHDTGFVTVLAPGDVLGLEVENARGEWIPVPTVANGLVVNLGEMLQAITGNYFVATPHRVVTHSPRQSIGYFHGPSLDTTLSPLALPKRFAEAVATSPRHANAGFMAHRDELLAGVGDMRSPHHAETYGQQLWNYFARSYPENVALHYTSA